MALKSYRELDVWKASMELVGGVYQLSASWAPEEKFGLTSQARRAAVSIAANIAEGYGRMTRKDYIRFLTMARGSTMELQTHLIIAVRIGIAVRDDVKPAWTLSQRVVRMLSSQIRSLSRTRTET